MAKGRLQAVGSALHLKQKFGAGYQVTLLTAAENVANVQNFFQQSVKGKH
jgi:hypothetical protein